MIRAGSSGRADEGVTGHHTMGHCQTLGQALSMNNTDDI